MTDEANNGGGAATGGASKGSSPDMEEYEVIPQSSQSATAVDEQEFPLHPNDSSS